MSSNLKPVGKHILINAVDEEIKTESGLLLSAKDADELRYKKAVVAVPGTDVTVVKTGDMVYFDKRAGYTMLVDGAKYTMIKEGDLVLVL